MLFYGKSDLKNKGKRIESMKKTISISGAVYIITGLLIAIGPRTIFPVCAVDGDMVMKCFYTAEAEFAVGIEIAVLGLLQFILRTEKAAGIISIAASLSAIAAFAIPNFIIGVCANEHMHCHSVTKPVLSILSALLLIVSAVYAYLFNRGAEINEKRSSYNQEVSG